MDIKIIRLRVCFLLVFCSLSGFTVAQTSKDIKQLQGKWVLEAISIRELHDSIPVSMNGLDLEIYSEIEMHQGELAFSHGGNIQRHKYEVSKDLIYLNFLNTSFYAEWAVFKNKLYIEWAQDVANTLTNELKKMVVLLVYEHKRTVNL